MNDKENNIAPSHHFAHQYKNHLYNANAASSRASQLRANSTSNSTITQSIKSSNIISAKHQAGK